MKCEECGGTEDVIESTTWWSTWGRCCFDFNWQKNHGSMKLCEYCEDENWVVCEHCGALVPREDEGKGYFPDDYCDSFLCPECAEKAGFELTVDIADCPF